jgi:hypothetical protein
LEIASTDEGIQIDPSVGTYSKADSPKLETLEPSSKLTE